MISRQCFSCTVFFCPVADPVAKLLDRKFFFVFCKMFLLFSVDLDQDDDDGDEL